MKTGILTLAIISLSAALCYSGPSDTGGFTPVFNGKDLTGWKLQARGDWKVENGELVGKPDPAEKEDCWLLSEEEWGDFTLELEFKVHEKGNSGIALRMPKDKTGSPDVFGYEMQICNVPEKHPTGSLLHHVDSKTNNVPKPNEWNALSITCEGEHIVIDLNGKIMLDTKEKGSKKGRIGMQIPKDKEYADQEVRFRNIKIKDLSKPAG